MFVKDEWWRGRRECGRDKLGILEETSPRWLREMPW